MASHPTLIPTDGTHTFVLAASMTTSALYGLGSIRARKRQPYGAEMVLLASLVLAGSLAPQAIGRRTVLPVGLSSLAAVGLYCFGPFWGAPA